MKKLCLGLEEQHENQNEEQVCEIREIMKPWKTHEILLIFSGAKPTTFAYKAEVAGSSPTKKEHKFMRFSLCHDFSYFYLPICSLTREKFVLAPHATPVLAF